MNSDSLFQEKITKDIIAKAITDYSCAKTQYGNGANDDFFSCHISGLSTRITGALSDCTTEYYESEKLEKEGKFIWNGNQLYRGSLNRAIGLLYEVLELCSYCNIKYKKMYRQSVKNDLNEQYDMHAELVRRDIANLKWDITKTGMKSIDKHNILEKIDSLEKLIFWNSREL